MRERPLLLDIVKLLFKPRQSRVGELPPAAANRGNSELNDGKASMMSLMGCQNKVIWALVEISALMVWKKEQKDQGHLSVKNLVSHATEVEQELEVKHYNTVKILDDFNCDVVTYSRYLTSHIFHASTILYLHTVVLGGYPHVPSVKLAAQEVICWICHIPMRPQTEVDKRIHKLVIRSTVFAFYITGAMTDNMKIQKLVLEYLLGEAGKTIGTIGTTASLLNDIWAERGKSMGTRAEVLWCEKLDRNQSLILLV